MYGATLTILTIWGVFLKIVGHPKRLLGVRCVCVNPHVIRTVLSGYLGLSNLCSFGALFWATSINDPPKENGTTGNQRNNDWLVSTHLKNMSQIGSFPQGKGGK